MTNFTALLIGIASSLVATFAFVALSELTRRVFLPWYADKIYRGVRLDGQWKACRVNDTELDPNTSGNEFVLVQKGDKISGTSMLLDKENNEKTFYKIKGQIRDGYFSATAWPVNSYMIDAMTCLFDVFYDNKKLRLRGRLIFLNTRTSEIVDAQCEYCKD